MKICKGCGRSSEETKFSSHNGYTPALCNVCKNIKYYKPKADKIPGPVRGRKYPRTPRRKSDAHDKAVLRVRKLIFHYFASVTYNKEGKVI